MKTKLMTGLRATAAASGVALLMLVAACGDSGDDGADQPPASQDAPAEEPADDTATDEDAEDAAATDEEAEEPADDTAEEDSAEGDDGDTGAAPAEGVVSPGDDFDPCTVITADDVNGILGSDFGEGSSSDMSSIAMCTFMDVNTGSSVIVQWSPVPGELDDALEAMASLYDDLGEPERVTVAGTDDAAVLSGQVSGFDATVLVGTADGGFLQVISTAQDMSSDQAVQIAEATLAGA